jgi:hypothetical protein
MLTDDTLTLPASNLQAKFRQIAARYHALAEELDDMAEDKALTVRAQRKYTGPGRGR